VDLIIDTAQSIGTFSVGETVKQFKNIKLLGTVTTSTTTNTVTKTDFGKLASTITILNGGTGYDNTSNNLLIFTGGGGTGAEATFANDVSGVITSVTVTNQGSNYTTLPTITQLQQLAVVMLSSVLHLQIQKLQYSKMRLLLVTGFLFQEDHKTFWEQYQASHKTTKSFAQPIAHLLRQMHLFQLLNTLRKAKSQPSALVN
jgi:hypothetical protein